MIDLQYFNLDGPVAISFSGGRTSAYMLRLMLDAGFAADGSMHVLFANTGKERTETLDFVSEVERRFGVPIHWVERVAGGGYREVAPISASRNGEPFAQLIVERRMLPNPVMRFCTQELKIRPMRNWMLDRGYTHWTNAVGIRADEPRRIARIREAAERRSERWDVALPLADAGLSLVDVNQFWASQPFGLQLRAHEGNCDLCFLKGLAKKRNIVRDTPELVTWWIQQERQLGDILRAEGRRSSDALFRHDQPSYADMLAQPDMFAEDESLTECFCTD